MISYSRFLFKEGFIRLKIPTRFDTMLTLVWDDKLSSFTLRVLIYSLYCALSDVYKSYERFKIYKKSGHFKTIPGTMI